MHDINDDTEWKSKDKKMEYYFPISTLDPTIIQFEANCLLSAVRTK